MLIIKQEHFNAPVLLCFVRNKDFLFWCIIFSLFSGYIGRTFCIITLNNSIIVGIHNITFLSIIINAVLIRSLGERFKTLKRMISPSVPIKRTKLISIHFYLTNSLGIRVSSYGDFPIGSCILSTTFRSRKTKIIRINLKGRNI